MSPITPDVTVVMSVFNGAGTLHATLDSVLNQKGCDFEFVVIDDGSTDGSGRILDERSARDSRLRVVHQANTGLTRALIKGCALAQGTFIARQDCGDRSLPGRLVTQRDVLRQRPECVAVSCGTRFLGPNDEFLYEVCIDESVLNARLHEPVEGHFRGPSHHGSMMMRRIDYEKAEGYRAAFWFAQDLDLWTRLVERGPIAVLPEVYYEAGLDPRSISGTQTAEQQRLAGLITQATLARRQGQPEASWLEEAAQVRPVKGADRAGREAAGNYFIGSCLRQRDPRAAARYFAAAVRLRPAMGRARVRWAQSTMGVRGAPLS